MYMLSLAKYAVEQLNITLNAPYQIENILVSRRLQFINKLHAPATATPIKTLSCSAI